MPSDRQARSAAIRWEFCGDEQPHERHEFIRGALRYDCPGAPTLESRLASGAEVPDVPVRPGKSAAHTELRELRVLLASKNHCSPELHKVGTQVVDALDRALAQACTNLATIRPSRRDKSLYEDALAWREALLDGLGSPW